MRYGCASAPTRCFWIGAGDDASRLRDERPGCSKLERAKFDQILPVHYMFASTFRQQVRALPRYSRSGHPTTATSSSLSW